LLLARVRDTYGGSPLDHLRKNEQKLIAEFSPEIELVLTQLQSFSNLTLLEFTRTDLIAMHKNMRRHHLRPRDALHLAAMQKVECSNIVNQDSDFERVPGIQHYTLT
jgi:predicted nucleic acid-binding protein